MDVLKGSRIVPVVVLDDLASAVPLAMALREGGITIVEFTLRTAAGCDAIAAIRKAMPDMTVGAGTVLSADMVQRAHDAGAQFALAPGLNPEVVEAARTKSLPFVPGVLTPSEIDLALRLQCGLLKFFPAQDAGGADLLSAIAAPFVLTGVKFLPTGGINETNLAGYLKLSCVAAVGGSWMVGKKLLAAKNWKQVAALSAQAWLR
jgi:2-dehydro-3-deoxyphosphogluconate aldolase/(4S)-4-hydroxy-2-oxoglutarate aldolase